PRVPTRFFPSIYLPHLSRMIPCSYWALACTAVLPSCVTSYVVSVRQARGLPVVSLFPHPASFRSRLAADTLAFGCILPTTGRIRDFHPLETCAAGRTTKRTPASGLPPDTDVLFPMKTQVTAHALIKHIRLRIGNPTAKCRLAHALSGRGSTGSPAP
ncbi:hypothetical protein SAMN04487771_105119, partial [[Clostridium] aminophilum]